ncbi:MAG: polyphosphate polymerase domain-containing protein [Clostridia bacterium]|nr:polyphosphate polymerase domain-containing protein [Clostridia bacterium]
MAYQAVFKRYELKYMLTSEQKQRILRAIEPYMALDKYGRTTIRNIYFDTDNYRLIRRSIEKPVYKEKLRIRSYCRAAPDSTVFVELKKKYDHVVYKRRLSMPEAEATEWLCGKAPHCHPHTQISSEIDYFIGYYERLRPTVFLCYDREAYYSRDGSDFRVTFDDNILCRCEELSLEAEAYGAPILEKGKVLMEIKCSGGIPLWMAHALSEEHLYKTSFSKYGTAYRTLIFPGLQKNNIYNTKEIFINA